MKRFDRRLALLLAAPGLLLLAFALGGGGFVWSTLEPDERGAVAAILESRGMLLVLAGAAVWALAAWALNRLYQQHVVAASQLLEQVQVRVGGEAQHPIEPQGDGTVRGLADAANALVAQRAQLRAEMAVKVEEASRHIDQERQRLAALMSELTQAVVVCNLDGRILLYNNRARAQFRALSSAPALGGGELIGLGRSIYAVVERRLVAHALESVQQRLQRGAAQPSAQFVTSTRAGQLLRAVMTPVRGDGAEAPVHGFVLMLDNITREYEADSARDQLLHGYTEAARASLGNLQAALEMLQMPWDPLESTCRHASLSIL